MAAPVGARTTERISVNSSGEQGNAYSGLAATRALSDDGRYVAFFSRASNLVEHDTNNRFDVFVYDRQTGEMTRVSVDSAGQEARGDSWWSAISGDGRFVAFSSEADNLVPDDTNEDADTFVRDRGEPIPGDLDGDGDVDQADLGMLLADWGCTPPDDCVGDIDGDGDTDQADLSILLVNWGTGS